ncbi:hypothetical protein HJG54_20840 [Leptolyngbya sp. NK1-12]|uniref:Uncharacterized protein n=1 Tax=Leptolyngbya sp. NK1-12 TaxID=2547451 RepID=A0AA96WMF8_9CYAN|nr:hypothetical protein [Leptolyngbya sp. NK1-12]WNZ25056.1 hypothetical protein HJG54_20840 [Leptolyngbya sp. NK1-12]
MLKDVPRSTSFGHSSSVGTMELIRPRASKSNAIRIRRSGFQDFRRVGRRENDPRYYRFTLKRSGRIDISVQNREFGGFLGFPTPTLKVRLERSNGKVLNRRTVRGGEFGFISRRLDRNTTYYIRISSSGESVPYRLGLRTRGGAELFR